MLLRDNANGVGWVLSSMHIVQRELTTVEGTDPLAGGARFIAELNGFIASWAVEQANAIERQRVVFNGASKQHQYRRNGFRPLSAAKCWHDYCNSTRKEIALIAADVAEARDKLYQGGWIQIPDTTPFPEFVYGEPGWKES
jgi:hypothetical protein